MQALVGRIRRDAVYLGDGIVKVDGFVNHQIDPQLTDAMGVEFTDKLRDLGIGSLDRVITAEVSGIPPAMATARELGVPLLYARKRRPATLVENCHQAEAPSRTKGGVACLRISENYLRAGENVVIVADFLATGRTILALAKMVNDAGARLRGIGCVIEKPVEGGRQRLQALDVPVVTLARVEWRGTDLYVS